MSQVFPSVYTFDVPDTFNTEVMATMQPTSLDALKMDWHSSARIQQWGSSPMRYYQ